MIVNTLSTLNIHKLTKEQYERIVQNGSVDENALYLTPEEEIDLSGYATIGQLDGKADKTHDHPDASISSRGFMTPEMVDKLSNISERAEVNQNAFSTINVGASSIIADMKSDTFSIAGSEYIDVSAENETINIKIQNLGSAAFVNANTLATKTDVNNIVGTVDDTAGTFTLHGLKKSLDAAVINGNSAIIGNDNDTSSSSTIYGAKKYATEEAERVLEEAKTYTNNKIGSISGAMHFKGFKDSIPTDNTGYESGDVINIDHIEYVFDGSTWQQLGDENSFVLKTQQINGHILSGDVTLTPSDIGADPAGTARELINDLSHISNGEGNYVSDITQENGKVTVSKATLPTTLPNPAVLTINNITNNTSKVYVGDEPVEISAFDLGAITEHQDISGKQDNLEWLTNEDIDAMFDGTYTV